MGTLKKSRLQSTEDARWQEIWQLYQNSFPPYEIRTEPIQKKLMAEESYYGIVFYEEEQLVGILFYWETETMRYVEHLAISPALRGKNYGTQMMQELCNTEKIVMLEIDPPIDEVSIKRQYFYERLGFHLNAFYFIHPSFSKIKHPHQLKILSYPREMTQQEFDSFLEYLNEKVLAYAEK